VRTFQTTLRRSEPVIARAFQWFSEAIGPEGVAKLLAFKRKLQQQEEHITFHTLLRKEQQQ